VTAEELRIEIAKALVRAGDDPADLYEWHPCVDTPSCRAAADPKSPCACSGIPYLSDAAWNELAPIIRRIQQGAAQPGPVLPTAKVPTPEEFEELRAAFHDGYFRERLGIWPDPEPPADSCACTIVGPEPACPVHHGRRARGPKPPPVGPGCICDGSGRTCPRHGTVI
jgi:hypothetical protein